MSETIKANIERVVKDDLNRSLIGERVSKGKYNASLVILDNKGKYIIKRISEVKFYEEDFSDVHSYQTYSIVADITTLKGSNLQSVNLCGVL